MSPAGVLPVSRFVQSAATFYGGELDGSYDVWRQGDRKVAIEAAYDYVHGETDHGPAARIPPYSLLGRVVWTSPRLEARAEVRHVGEQDRVTTFEIPTDAYDLVSAKVSWRLFAHQDVRIFLDGRNLTDQEAREHTSFLKDIAPLPGRTVRVGFAAAF